MKSELSLKTAVCGTYQRLLQRCAAKFEVWKSRRQEICEEGSFNEESGSELLRMQADYAKAYNDLCKHVGGCEICKLSSFTDHDDGAKDSNLVHMADLPAKNGIARKPDVAVRPSLPSTLVS